MEIRSVESELFNANRQTDRKTGGQRDMSALIDSFRNFGNAPKSYASYRFCRATGNICALLPYYPAYSGNFVPTLQDDPSVPSSRVKKTSWPLKIWPIGFPETSNEITTVRWVTCQKNADLIYRRLNMDRQKRRVETRACGETWFWVKGSHCTL